MSDKKRGPVGYQTYQEAKGRIAELEQRLKDSEGRCASRDKVIYSLEAELAELENALLSAPPCKTEKYMSGEIKVMGGPAIDRYYHWYTQIRRKALQEKGE